MAIVISLFALAASFLTLYWEHIYSSEDVYLAVNDYMYSSKSQAVGFDLVLMNEGNKPVIISKISFGLCNENPECCDPSKGPMLYAKKWNMNEFAYPIYLSPNKIEMLKASLNLESRLPAPVSDLNVTFTINGITSQQQSNPPNPLASTSPDLPAPVGSKTFKQYLTERTLGQQSDGWKSSRILLIFDTIGPSRNHQTVAVPAMTLSFQNDEVVAYGPPKPGRVMAQIRMSGFNILNFFERGFAPSQR